MLEHQYTKESIKIKALLVFRETLKFMRDHREKIGVSNLKPFTPRDKKKYFPIMSLLERGSYTVEITSHKKYTIAEITILHKGHYYRFHGISAKDPRDPEDMNRGESNAIRAAIRSFLNENLEP